LAHLSKWTVRALLLVLAVLPAHLPAQPTQEAPLALRKVIISHGIELHYVERGTGVPVVFVHGSLSDGGYWTDQVNAFAKAAIEPLLTAGVTIRRTTTKHSLATQQWWTQTTLPR